jgi:histone H3/H4
MSEGERKPIPVIPKEAQVMVSILRDLGIHEYDPGVLTQMLEFSYRYISSILEDARVYSNHARKRVVDLEDVKLAVQVNTEQSVTGPPTREVLLDLAQARNSTQLPLVKPGVGLRLPPDRHCLTNTNYRLRSARGGAGQTARKTNGVATPQFNIQIQQPGTKRKWDE